MSGVDTFLLNQQDRHSLSKKSYLPASGGAGHQGSSGFLERAAGAANGSKDTSEGAQSGQGRHRGFTKLKGGEEQHPHCGASHPFVPVSPRGFERCHPSGKLRTGLLWSLQPAAFVGGHCPPPPPLTLIPRSGPPPRPPFPSGAHTSPDFEDFPRSRSLCGRSLASPCLSSAPVGSAEPEGKQLLVAASLPDAFLAFWLEIWGLFLRKLFPSLDSWKPSWSFDVNFGGKRAQKAAH